MTRGERIRKQRVGRAKIAAKRSLLGLIAGVTVVSPSAVYAADILDRIAAETPTPEISAAPAGYQWDGVYFGGQLGGLVAPSNTTLGSGTVTGLLGGFVGGYNFQPFEKVVTGVEADLSFVTLDRSINLGGATGSVDTDLIGTVTGRIGYLPLERVLVYGEAGLAGGLVNSTIGGVSNKDLQPGYVLGAGAEFALDDKITFIGEYNFVDLKNKNLQSGGATASDSLTSNQIKAGVKFKF